MGPPTKIIGTAQRYEIEKTIASGAFSRVYRCRNQATGQHYAAKVVSKTVASKYQMTETLQREADAMKRIGVGCPHVVTFVDAFVSNHNYYFIMGLSEGGTLLEYARTTRKTLASTTSAPSAATTPSLSAALVERTAVYTKQLLLGLESIHACNVVHRDIKPENLLLSKDGSRVMISDFGFACYAPEGQTLHRSCGTLRYCAPELLEEDPVYDGRKVDVWAAGVTVFVLLFHAHPFRPSKTQSEKSEVDAFLRVIRETELAFPKTIPAQVEDFLRKALCKDPRQRWSVAQLLSHPWMTSVNLDLYLTDGEEDAAHDSAEASRTACSSSGEYAHVRRAGSMTSLSSLAAARNSSTWDSLLETDDGFYEVSQMRQGSRTGMSDSQEEYGSYSASATTIAAHHSPPHNVCPDSDEDDSPHVSGEWVVAGTGRVHASECPRGETEHFPSYSESFLHMMHVVLVTLLNVVLFGVGRACRAVGLKWRSPPNADAHFAAVDAAIAESNKKAALEDDFDAVFDSLFDGSMFSQAFSGISTGPRLAVGDDAHADTAHLTLSPHSPVTSSTRRTSCPPVFNQRPANANAASSNDDEDPLADDNGVLVDEKAEHDELVRILNTPSGDEAAGSMEVPYSPSAPLPYSKLGRQLEDFPSTMSQEAIAAIE